MKSYRIATIPGDGIGQEVVPQGIRVLNATGRKFGINFDWDHLPWRVSSVCGADMNA